MLFVVGTAAGGYWYYKNKYLPQQQASAKYSAGMGSYDKARAPLPMQPRTGLYVAAERYITAT